MNKSIKTIALVLSLFTCLTFTSCKSSPTMQIGVLFKEALKNVSDVSSGIIAENQNFSLSWNDATKNVILCEKASGKIWSTTPMSDGSEVKDSDNIFSPINLTYVLCSGHRTLDLTGKLGSINEGHVYAKSIDNGIELTFFFDKVSIAVPIRFTLTNEGLDVSVDSDNIIEDKTTDFRAFEIELLPFFASLKNTSHNYLFYPSGCGALMYCDERNDGVGREYLSKVYGMDISEERHEKISEENAVRMPVFGSVSKDNTMCGIITSGAESAFIYAKSGDKTTGYSNICAKFRLRGYNPNLLDYGGSTGRKIVNDYSENIASGRTYKVSYSVLKNNNKQGYVRIADKYRNYISKKYNMTSTGNQSILSLKVYGAIQVKKFFFGVPYYTQESLTGFSDALKIIKTIRNKTAAFDVDFIGYGKTGISNQQLCGGFKFASAVGNKNELSSVINYAKKNNINLYFDYDIVGFSKSGNGFSALNNVVQTTNGYPIQIFNYNPDINTKNTAKAANYVLSRNKISEVPEKLLKMADKYQLTGLALSSISNTAYSDYADDEYPVCKDIQKDVMGVLEKISENKYFVASTDANDYAAVCSNKIFDTPSHSSFADAFDFEIPFYQMVFHGQKSISLNSANLAVNYEKAVLKSIESGSGLQFSIINNYSTDYAFEGIENLQLMKWKNNSEKVLKAVESYEELFEKVKNSKITDYVIISKNVRKTVFSNGIEVFVNYGQNSFAIGDMVIDAMNYKVVQ